MIRVSITNITTNQIGWASQFESQDDANTWISQGITSNWWGKPQRTLTANSSGSVPDIDGSNADISKAISTGTTTDGDGNTVNTYLMPVEYTVSQTDITAQIDAEAALAKGLQAQQTGAQCVAQVWALNEAKFAAGTLNSTDFQTILADSTLQQIERLLWNGSLATAKAMIQAYTSPYFTSDDIASVVAIIDNSGLV